MKSSSPSQGQHAATGVRLALTLSLFAAMPAMALSNATTTTSFSDIGNFSNGLNGELIAPNWVLTAAHVAAGLTAGSSTYTNGDGTSIIDATYLFDGSSKFPDNDIALVHLSSAINSTSIPVLNDTVLDFTTFGQLATALGSPITSVTLANSLSPSQRSFGLATPNSSSVKDGSGNTVNYLVTDGPTDLQSGDSGSALFSGAVTDSSSQILLGIASGSATDSTLGVNYSYFVQAAPYKSWINSTITSSGLTGSNQAVRWTSALAAPEPSTLAIAGVGLALLASTVIQRRSPYRTK